MIEENKKSKGRPRIYTDRERVKQKTNYMTTKSWFCDVCNNGIDYSLAGKSQHRYTKNTVIKSYLLIIKCVHEKIKNIYSNIIDENSNNDE